MGLFSKPEVIGPGGGNDADRARIAELEERVARLEAQVAGLAQQRPQAAAAPGAAASDGWMAEVQALRRDGKTIHAIKLYREHTGVGLKQAKDAVEAMPG
jgi:large subunit ribosomal protein L7/L12